jgi:hypothetical protein
LASPKGTPSYDSQWNFADPLHTPEYYYLTNLGLCLWNANSLSLSRICCFPFDISLYNRKTANVIVTPGVWPKYGRQIVGLPKRPSTDIYPLDEDLENKLNQYCSVACKGTVIKIETTLNELAKNENIYNTRFRDSNWLQQAISKWETRTRGWLWNKNVH